MKSERQWALVGVYTPEGVRTEVRVVHRDDLDENDLGLLTGWSADVLASFDTESQALREAECTYYE